MKKILTLVLAFMVLTIMPQIVSAQTTPSKEEVKKEAKKASKAEKKEIKQVKKEVKPVTQDAKKMTDAESQQQVVEEKKVAEEVKVNKNEPRPYVSQKIEKPKKGKPKTQHKANENRDQ